jgi:hypothetical protein
MDNKTEDDVKFSEADSPGDTNPNSSVRNARQYTTM